MATMPLTKDKEGDAPDEASAIKPIRRDITIARLKV